MPGQGGRRGRAEVQQRKGEGNLSRVTTGCHGAVAAEKDTLSQIASRATKLNVWWRTLEVMMSNGTVGEKQRAGLGLHVVGEVEPRCKEQQAFRDDSTCHTVQSGPLALSWADSGGR